MSDWIEEGYRATRWVRWFAWRPIKTFDEGWIWLVPYWRWQSVWGWGFFDDFPYRYKDGCK